ncbi:hemolysin family protein [Zhihengliuella flava]|uniref:CBS domain containing-hemolysin-like protein n=1 Tax=Zhihengliuella flava TaxID=1285193 RepID=A0A931GHW3_9MICC|nr:hemolysin family protein [Zhihengliuella flava]MBG6083661.1 CBS domain containing-hemolysin-like protein [Zhihengliuella flava]
MEWLYLGFGLLLILGTGFFVAVEFSLVALDQTTVRAAINAGDRGAKPLLRCLKTLSTQLSSCQLGITLTTLLTGYVMEPSVGRLLAPVFEAWGFDAAAGPAALIVAMVLATLLSMLIGELVPKNLAIAKAFVVGKALARPQLLFTAVFKPAIVVLNGFSNWILSLMGLEAKEELSSARNPEELASLVRRSADLGTLDQETANFLSRSLRFAERSAADVMTPRIRMESVRAEDPLEHIIQVARRTGFSRFPVIGQSPDDVLGVCHIKKAVAVPRERRHGLVAANVMSEIISVPETVHLDSLLAELREANLQVAMVLDEYGGTAGMVTLEDLVEEIVGEVADEHDRTMPGVLQAASGDWYFPGMLRPDEIGDHIAGLTIPEDGAYETAGGYMMAELGRIPDVGDCVDLERGQLVVVRMEGRRVERLRYIPVHHAEGPEVAA